MRRLGCLACALGVFLCAGTPVAAQFDVNAAFERINAPELDVPRMVLAFYYAWYRNAEVPSGSGRWAHWEGVLEEDQKIDSSTHYPKLGPYDSLDPELIAQHCAWAREAGIDGLIVSWWGSDCFEDRVLPPLLEACAASGLKVTIYYERVPQPQTVSATVTDLLAALELHADHPAWLRVEDRPVVFVYGRALNQIGLAGWTSVAAEVNRRYAPGVVLMGDQISRASACIFDGVHTYVTAGALKDKDVGQVRAWAKSAYRDWVAIAERMGRISTVTVMPGFDNTRGREQGLKVERFSGRSYRTQWEAALRAEPDWVLITSWNEWHEGSEIEPSVEHGDEYISMTTRFAERFKKRPRRTKAPLSSPHGISAKMRARLRDRLDEANLAVLPDPDSYAMWWLLQLGVKPRLLTWEHIANGTLDARRPRMLLCAAKENYRQTVAQTGDVDVALQRYLTAGGMLVALPAGPIPFYSTAEGKGVHSAPKFGLNVIVAWEQPPAGRRLNFTVNSKALPHVPAKLAFPTGGDRRWRPFRPVHIAAEDEYVPLLRLQDDTGTQHGDGACYVEYKTGHLRGAKVLYAWFRLLDAPEADVLLHDLFTLALDRLGS